MLNITAIGNLTNDVVLRTREGEEQPYAILRVASNRRYRISDGTRPVDFVSVRVRGKLAEICAKYGKKGVKVAIVGELELNPADNADRNPSVLIKAKTVDFITRPELDVPETEEGN